MGAGVPPGEWCLKGLEWGKSLFEAAMLGGAFVTVIRSRALT